MSQAIPKNSTRVTELRVRIAKADATFDDGLTSSAERRLARYFLVFPAASALILASLAATFLGPVEAIMGERFGSVKAVPVLRAEMVLAAALAFGVYPARRKLTALLGKAHSKYAGFRDEAAPRPAPTPVIERIILWFTAAMALFFAAFHLLPRLLKREQKLAAYLRHLGLPRINPGLVKVFSVALAAWFIVGIGYGTLGFHPGTLWGYYNQLDDELFKFFMAYSYLAFAFLDAAEAGKSRRLAARNGPTVEA